MFLPIFFVARQTQKRNMGQQPQRTAHPTHICKRRGSTIIVSAKNNSFNVNVCCGPQQHAPCTHDTLPVDCGVEKCFFYWRGALSHATQTPRRHMYRNWHVYPHVGSGFSLAASIQRGEHLRQHKAHQPSQLKKPQNNIIIHPKWHPNDVGGTLGAPNPHTHQRAHLFAPPTGPFGMLLAPPLPPIAPQIHERTRVPTLDISE